MRKLPYNLTRRPASRIVKTQSTARKSVGQSHIRLTCVAIFFALSFAALMLRLVEVSLVGGGALPFKRLVSEPHLLIAQDVDVDENVVPAKAIRRDITDRNGVVIATSVATASLAANPTLIRYDRETADALAALLPDTNRQALYKRLANKRSSFTYIKRHLTPAQQEAVNNLGIPGLFFEPDARRIYPYGHLFAHVLGFVDIDNKGLAGMERKLNRSLMEPWHEAPVALSIDVRAQAILHEELLATVKKFHAIGATAIVSDIRNGEIIALASLPDFDPHKPQKASAAARFNRASLGAYEMGSVFKTFTLAAALENDVIGLHSGYDASNPIKVARFSIRDSHPKARWLSVPEILAYSSNIGMVKMAMDLGTDKLKSFFDRLGLFAPVATDLPEISSPLFPKKWREINTMTASYGHGISVSPLHVVRAMSALVGDGQLRPLTLLKNGNQNIGDLKPVVSAETSARLQKLLRLVVMHGTAKFANIAGYAVGGKTGTAEKVQGKKYKMDAKLATFVGVFPAYNPRYTILVTLDEPQGIKATYGYATGGWVSAPVAGRFIARAAPALGLAPQNYEAEKAVEALWVRTSTEKQKRKRVQHAAF
jgi:cell division protein FtsI (penicillin-binding protein 3)